MTCSQAAGVLEAYFEGSLPEKKAALVAAHLRGCATCSEQLAQIGKITAALAAVPRSEPGWELAQQITARVAALPASAGRRGLLAGWRRLEVLAAAFLVLLTGWRYALPILLSEQVAKMPVVIWIRHAGAHFLTWAAAFGEAGHDLWLALRETSPVLRPAATAAAPTLALYAVAEILIIAAIILLAHRARRTRLASTTILL